VEWLLKIQDRLREVISDDGNHLYRFTDLRGLLSSSFKNHNYGGAEIPALSYPERT